MLEIRADGDGESQQRDQDQAEEDGRHNLDRGEQEGDVLGCLEDLEFSATRGVTLSKARLICVE